jgi:hypothetical protein
VGWGIYVYQISSGPNIPCGKQRAERYIFISEKCLSIKLVKTVPCLTKINMRNQSGNQEKLRFSFFSAKSIQRQEQNHNYQQTPILSDFFLFPSQQNLSFFLQVSNRPIK